MLLSDDQGNTVTWFDDYFNDNPGHDHYMHLTGGTDSALTLFIMAKIITERALEKTDTIHCLYANFTYVDEGFGGSTEVVKRVFNAIQDRWPNVSMELHIENYDKKNGQDKTAGLNSLRMKHSNDNNDPPINSIQLSPSHLSDYVNRNATNIIQTNKKNVRPYSNVTKKFIKYYFDKFNMMNDIYHLTESCTCPPGPCYCCYWCKEKYWAFGSYDGGVTPMMTHILTLKVGTKYGSEYVNNLFRSIKKNSTEPFTLYCYTEDPIGLDNDIVVVPLKEPSEFALQWHKVKFHEANFAGIATGEKCLILDIDWIITEDMDAILNYKLPKNAFGCFERWWSNLRHLCAINGGFQMYHMGDTNHLWEIFKTDAEYWQSYYVLNGLATGPVNGEQNFIDMHVTLEREWLPMKWFAKWQEDDWLKIQKNWNENISKKEPYYMGGDFAESIKMVHFSNADNLITEAMEKHDWIRDFWN